MHALQTGRSGLRTLSACLPRILTVSRAQPSTQQSPRRRRQPSTSRAASTSAHDDGHDADAHGHESHYDPPSGWLWGIPPGEKKEKEGWEGIWIYGFFGSLGLAVVGYAYKPDTSIQTWALEEARRRLEAEGILPDPEKTKK
ncbi:MAG: hypothetical protein M1827_003240 [Pycnora praestabilis]|nr:MAG: hypothetical protein M1827_003240 [Pycnora praestabilis]